MFTKLKDMTSLSSIDSNCVRSTCWEKIKLQITQLPNTHPCVCDNINTSTLIQYPSEGVKACIFHQILMNGDIWQQPQLDAWCNDTLRWKILGSTFDMRLVKHIMPQWVFFSPLMCHNTSSNADALIFLFRSLLCTSNVPKVFKVEVTISG